jgi:hypothetical protein
LIFYKKSRLRAFNNAYIILRYTEYKLNKGAIMAKGKDVQKSVKTASTKSLKEKRAEKKAKKAGK